MLHKQWNNKIISVKDYFCVLCVYSLPTLLDSRLHNSKLLINKRFRMFIACISRSGETTSGRMQKD